MINHPKLLLADEPTGALDSATSRQVMEIFRKLNSEGVTILMITHDPNVAACADRCVTILDGVLSEGLFMADAVQPAEDEIKETEQSAEEDE